MEMFPKTMVPMLVLSFLSEKGLDLNTVEKLSENARLDLVAEFAQWSADIIKAQCEKEKERNANG